MWGKFWWEAGKGGRDGAAAGTPVVRPSEPEAAPVVAPGTTADGRADEIAEFLTRFYTHQQC